MRLFHSVSIGVIGFGGGIIAVGLLLVLSSTPRPVTPSELALFGKVLVQIGATVALVTAGMLLMCVDPLTLWKQMVSPLSASRGERP